MNDKKAFNAPANLGNIADVESMVNEPEDVEILLDVPQIASFTLTRKELEDTGFTNPQLGSECHFKNQCFNEKDQPVGELDEFDAKIIAISVNDVTFERLK